MFFVFVVAFVLAAVGAVALQKISSSIGKRRIGDLSCSTFGQGVLG